jgi:hypothetical protein
MDEILIFHFFFHICENVCLCVYFHVEEGNVDDFQTFNFSRLPKMNWGQGGMNLGFEQKFE